MNEEHELRDYEINLVDLMFFSLEKWRYILVVMIIFALAAGGYKYRAAWKENQYKQQEMLVFKEEEQNEEKIPDGQEIKEIDFEMVKSYKQAITESERSLKKQEDYLNQSVVMQLDPYCISTGTLSYYLEGGDHIDTLLSSYQVYVSDGILAKELYSVNPEISVEDLRYLISFTNSADVVYELGNNQVIQAVKPGEAVFKIQIRMPDSELCELYLKQAEKCVADYAYRLQTEVTGHDLMLLSSTQAEKTDLEIGEYQSGLQTKYITAVKNLQVLKSELDTLLASEDEEAAAGDDEEAAGTEEIVLADPVSSAVKYAIAGALMGAFLSCIVFMGSYMLNGRLQNTENFKTEYGIPVLGSIYVLEIKRKFFGFIDAWIYKLRTGVFARISFEEQIKMAAVNIRASIGGESSEEKAKRIMLAGTIPVEETAGVCDRLVSEMPEVSFSTYKQIAFQSMTLRETEDYDAVLFLEKRGVSYSKLIIQERKLALANHMNILGAIVLA